MRVITSAETLTGTELPADFPVERYNRIWTEGERFLEVSKRAERLLVDGSGHQLQLERPEVVLEAILDVIDEARRLQATHEEEAAADPMGTQPALEGQPEGGPSGANAEECPRVPWGRARRPSHGCRAPPRHAHQRPPGTPGPQIAAALLPGLLLVTPSSAQESGAPD